MPINWTVIKIRNTNHGATEEICATDGVVGRRDWNEAHLQAVCYEYF
jgi:hypothetical protein